MTSSFHVRILILWILYLLRVWINLAKSLERLLFSVILETSHNQILAASLFLENIYHWLKFKARSPDIFFSWTFDLHLINLCNFIWSLISNIVRKHMLRMTDKIKTRRYTFLLDSDVDIGESCIFTTILLYMYIKIYTYIYIYI